MLVKMIYTANMSEKGHTTAVGAANSFVAASRRIAAAAGAAVWGKRRRHVEFVFGAGEVCLGTKMEHRRVLRVIIHELKDVCCDC